MAVAQTWLDWSSGACSFVRLPGKPAILAIIIDKQKH